MPHDPADASRAPWWEIPGGGIDPGEDSHQGAARELYEESGIRAEIGPCIWRQHNIFDFAGLHFDQQEYIHVAWCDGEPVAMSPELICVLDTVSGEAVGTETIRYGQRVTVIALPPPKVFLSEKGLAHVGPRAFGYDIEFKSVFS